MKHEKLGRPYSAGLRSLVGVAVVMLVVLLGGFLFWVSTAAIGGAVIATGQVMVESNAKEIEHSEGGYVAEILVREGDTVEAGETLLRLDDTRASAQLAIIRDQLNEMLATEARLLAETAELSDFSISQDDMAFATPGEKLDSVLQAQRVLLQARRTSVEGRLQQLSEQIAQTGAQIDGLVAQVGSNDLELELITAELDDVEQLVSSGLTTEQRANALRRDKARIEGERGALIAAIAQARLAISEREVQKIRIVEEARRESLEQLQSIRLEKVRLIQEKITAEDLLRRLNIVTFQTGVVHDLNVRSVNAVVQPGETLMTIVPQQDQMVIEARIAPGDIDQVYQGQEARLLFSAFNMRTTPELYGEVARVSPDISVDEVTGLSYYRSQLKIAPGEVERLGDNEIIPGMPVEAFIRTEERTVADYLIQPLMDHLRRTFREE